MKKISANEIKLFAQFIYKAAGIYLDETKAYLLETRLSSLLDEQGCDSFSDLYYKAQSDGKGILKRKIVDALTTNETLFFRDKSPFELLQHKILPDLIDHRSSNSSGLLPKQIRIWSAACSSGQEVYSIAIVLKELSLDPKKFNIKLLGTDISDAAIAQASYGQYNKFEIDRGLPKDKLLKYFTANGSTWKIKDEIRAMVNYKKLNLMDSLSSLGKFDIIFCRNVAIYFTLEDRTKLFDRIADVLEEDGYLIIGSTESLTGVSAKFQPMRYLGGVFYQRQ